MCLITSSDNSWKYNDWQLQVRKSLLQCTMIRLKSIQIHSIIHSFTLISPLHFARPWACYWEDKYKWETGFTLENLRLMRKIYLQTDIRNTSNECYSRNRNMYRSDKCTEKEITSLKKKPYSLAWSTNTSMSSHNGLLASVPLCSPLYPGGSKTWVGALAMQSGGLRFKYKFCTLSVYSD